MENDRQFKLILWTKRGLGAAAFFVWLFMLYSIMQSTAPLSEQMPYCIGRHDADIWHTYSPLQGAGLLADSNQRLKSKIIYGLIIVATATLQKRFYTISSFLTPSEGN